MLIDFAINFHGKGLAHYDIKLGNVLVKFASSDNTQIVKMKVITSFANQTENHRTSI